MITPPHSTSVKLRSFEKSDLRAVLAIERRSDMEDLYSDDDFLLLASQTDRGIIVAEREQRIVGYIAYDSSTQNDTLMSLVVHHDHRNQGIGRRLLKPFSRRRTLAIVRESSLVAQLFLRSCGFECFRTDEDVFKHPPEAGLAFHRLPGKHHSSTP